MAQDVLEKLIEEEENIPVRGMRAKLPVFDDYADISEAAKELISLQEGLQKETMKRFLGTEEEILVEGLSRRSEHQISGKGLHGISVTTEGSSGDIGRIVRCRITGLKNNTLTAERI